MSLRDMFSRNKRKRTLSSTGDPSATNHSFVNNVKSQMSRLMPARLSQWFISSASNATENGSISTSDCTDSSEDESDPVPPTKRKRFNTDSQYNQCFQLEPNKFQPENSEISNNHNVLYTSIQTSPGRNTFIREANYTSTRFIPNTDEPNTEAASLQNTSKDVSYKSVHIPSTSQSVASIRKSIFKKAKKPKDNAEEKIRKCFAQETSSLSDVKPRFRPSLYGSPFYPGPTMYGGASASTYINRPIINYQKVVRVGQPPKENSSNLSSSSRKILDLMENCSSPLIEAKRIPAIQSRNRSLNSGNPYLNTSKPHPHKVQELVVPGVASILRVKQLSRLMDTTKAARQILASHSSTQPGISLTPDFAKSNSSKSTQKEESLKLKTRLTRANRGEDNFIVPEPVQLPTAVLHIDKDNLPKFSITSPTITTTVISSSSTKTQVTCKMNSIDRSIFKFSIPTVSPIAMSQDLQIDNESKMREETTQPNTFFNKVEKPVVTSTFGPKPLSTPAAVVSNTMEIEEKDWKCDICWIKNKSSMQKCAACGGSKPGGKENVPVFTPTFPKIIINTVDEWKCETCWIKNKNTMKKCAACGDSKPGRKESTTSSAPHDSQPEEDRKCDDCGMMNRSSMKTCAACGGAKPGVKENTKPEQGLDSCSPFYKSPDAKFQEIMRAQKSKWECSVCTSRNEPDKTKCQCCETEREGPSKEITPKPFTFPKESNINFKFGIDPKEQEKNIAKKAEEGTKVGLTMLEQTETNNNNTYVKIPALMASHENKSNELKSSEKKDSDKTDSVVPEGPSVSFTFGILKSGHEKLSAKAIVPSVDEPIEKPAQVSCTFGAGFIAPPKSGQETPPKTFSSFVNTPTTIANKIQHITTEPAAVSLAHTNLPNNEKEANIGFQFSKANTAKLKQVSFAGETYSGAGSSGTTSPFTFGSSQQATTVATVTTHSVPLFSSPVTAVATAALSAPLFSTPQPATNTASHTGPVFSSQQAPVTTAMLFSSPQAAITTAAISTSLFSSPQAAITTASISTSLFSNSQPVTASSKPSAGIIFGVSQPATAPVSVSPAATPLFSLRSDASSAVSTPFTFGGTNNDSKKASLFGSTNNNDNKASPFGNGFKSAGASSAFAMSKVASLPGASSISTSSMSGVDEPGTVASNNVFGAEENAWSGKNERPFTFGAIGNQFSASGAGAGGSGPALFGAQPAAGAQNVFGMSSSSGNSGGLFGSTLQQPAQHTSIFGAQPAPSLFGVQNQSSAFGTSAPSQPPAFGAPAPSQPPAFGAPTPSQPPAFGVPAPSQPPVFGASAPTQPPAFGTPAPTQPPAFGAQSQPAAFGASAPSQPPAFGAPAPTQPASFAAPAQGQPPVFGASTQNQPASFGAPTQSQSSAFGAPTSNQPTVFGVPAQPSAAPTPAFNFGSSVFSFGQQAQQQSQPSGVYSFGGGMSAGMGSGLMSQPMDGGIAGGAQFNVGSAPAQPGAARRMRKAVRRNPQR